MVDVFSPHQQPQVRAQLGNILMAICSQRLIPALGGGRVAASEILVATPAVRNIIREGNSYPLEAVIQPGAEFGMQSMDRELVNLIHAGTISYDEARNYAVDLDELDRLMRS
jgi:twitching motility protein PilT